MKISKVHCFGKVRHFAGSPADFVNYTPPCARAGVYFRNKPANWRTGEEPLFLKGALLGSKYLYKTTE